MRPADFKGDPHTPLLTARARTQSPGSSVPRTDSRKRPSSPSLPAGPACMSVLREARTHLVSGAQSPAGFRARRAASRTNFPRPRPRSQGRSLPRSPPAPPAFRNPAWRVVLEAPRRRQAEPIGASGQLPPRPQASLLLLLKDPPERVYVEPCKLPAPDFAISQEIRTCACKRGLGAAGPT